MIDRKTYNLMKKYGDDGSWAVWSHQTEKGKPKSNMGDMEWARDEKSLLPKLNPKFVLVGLNKSKRKKNTRQNENAENDNAKTPWKNFHSGNSRGHSYKLRYALKGTKFWGAYMTDLLKEVKETNSKNVMSRFKKDKTALEKQMKDFEREISCLGGKPVLIALGKDVFSFLQPLKNKYKILPLTHYSYTGINKEQYRAEVLKAQKQCRRGFKE